MADDEAAGDVAATIEGLVAELGERYSPESIREAVEHAAQQYADARIKLYVPIIARRLARARLLRRAATEL